jgi:PAS domain S-box-containing protein
MDELLNNAPCGFLVVTDDGKLVEANQTLIDLLGYERGEFEGLHIEKILPVAGRIFYQTHFFPLLKLHGKVEEIYLSLRTRLGEEIPVLANAVRHERGGTFFNDCVLMPMYRRNQFEDELVKAKKEAEAATLAKDEFLSVVSHELRTPLNAIFGWTQILLSKEPDAKTVRYAIETIERSAKSQRMLIEDILDLARITSGKLSMDVGRVNLAKTIESAVEIVAPAANAKEIRLETALDSSFESKAIVSGDSSRLQQVLWNLLSNSVKFTPNGGSVQVRLERVDSNVEISVRDTGQGIAPEFLPHVFERFRQIDNSTTKRHSGLGLGLAITRHIVELHGGTIRAESSGEHLGATFTVNLPVINQDSGNELHA